MTVAAVIGQGATFLTGVLIANTVGTRQFGIYGFLQGTLTNWSLVASMSSGLLATRYLAAYGHSDAARAGQVLGYCTIVTASAGCLAGIVLWLARMALVRNVDNATAMISGLGIVAAALPFACLTLFQTGALVGLERFRLQAILSSIQSVGFIAGPLVGALAHGAVGAMAGLACAYFLRFITHGAAVRNAAAALGIKTRVSGTLSMSQLFLRFALPGTLTGLIANGSIWFGSFLLVGQIDGSHEMGLFAAALNFRLLVLFLPVQIAAIGVPMLTRHQAAGEDWRFATLLRAVTIITAAIAGSVALILGLLAPQVLRIFGPGFVEAQTLARLLLVGVVAEAIAGAIYQALPSRELMWRSFLLVALPRDTTLLMGSLILVPRWQGVGLAAAMVLSQCVGLAGVMVARKYRR
jgi:O-antigen/teichoic acid export membrane protein